MSWLKEDEDEFPFGYSTRSVDQKIESDDPTHQILLKKIKILDNKKLFFSSKILVYVIIIDGFPDIKKKNPFWEHLFVFDDVKDNDDLITHTQTSPLIYSGHPRDFINIHILVARDTSDTRKYAEMLKESMIGDGLGLVSEATISIFSGNPKIGNVIGIRKLVKKVFNRVLNKFTKKENKIIGAYYGSLLEYYDFRKGNIPKSYPPEGMKLGNSLEIAYEVLDLKEVEERE